MAKIPAIPGWLAVVSLSGFHTAAQRSVATVTCTPHSDMIGAGWWWRWLDALYAVTEELFVCERSRARLRSNPLIVPRTCEPTQKRRVWTWRHSVPPKSTRRCYSAWSPTGGREGRQDVTGVRSIAGSPPPRAPSTPPHAADPDRSDTESGGGTPGRGRDAREGASRVS